MLIGFSVGCIGGFFGMGGAWMVTPGLNILGFPMAFAIGTDIAHIAGKSMVSTMRHSKFGNVDYKLGLIMIVGTMAGIEVGAQIIISGLSLIWSTVTLRPSMLDNCSSILGLTNGGRIQKPITT